MESLKIKVDLKRKTVESINLQQGYTYPVEVQVFDNGQEYNCVGATAQVHFGKPNGKFTIKTKDITIEENKIRFKIDGSMTNISGASKLQVVLTKGEDIFGSWVIYTSVFENAIQDSDTEDSNSIDVLTDLTKKISIAEPLVDTLTKQNPIASDLNKKLALQIPQAESIVAEAESLIRDGGAVDRRELGEKCFTDFEGNEYSTLEERLNGDFGGLYEAINNATYLEYEGHNVKVDHSYKGMTKDIAIQGNTLQNLVKDTANSETKIKGEMDSEEGTFVTLQNTSAGIVDVAPMTLETFSGKTHLMTENYLMPKVKVQSIGIEYPVMLKPNTDYTVRWSTKEGNSDIGLTLGGSEKTTVAHSKGIATLRTPSTLVNENLVVSGWNTKVKDVAVYEGAINDPGKLPYIQGIESSGELITDEQDPSYGRYKVKARTCGKNLFDVNEFVNVKGINTNNDNNIYYGVEDGCLVTLPRYDHRTWVSVGAQSFKPNTKYTISVEFGDVYVEVWVPNGEKTSGFGKVSFSTRSTGEVKFKFNAGVETEVKFKVMLEENTQPTQYEEYQQDYREFYLDEPLRRLPNGVCDEILEDGTLIRRVGETVLNGLENWTNGSRPTIHVDTNWYRTDVTIVCGGSGFSDGISDTLPYKYRQTLYESDEEGITIETKITQSHSRLIVCIKKSKLSSDDANAGTTAFKEYLKQNPIKLLYELRTPIISKISNTINLKTFNNTTHFIADTYVPLNLKAKFPVDVQATISLLASRNRDLELEVERVAEEKQTLEGQIKGLKEGNELLNDKLHQVDSNLKEKMGTIESAIDGFNQMLVSVIPLLDEKILKK